MGKYIKKVNGKKQVTGMSNRAQDALDKFLSILKGMDLDALRELANAQHNSMDELEGLREKIQSEPHMLKKLGTFENIIRILSVQKGEQPSLSL